MRSILFLLPCFGSTLCLAQTGKLIAVDTGIERMNGYRNGGEVRTKIEMYSGRRAAGNYVSDHYCVRSSAT